MNYGPLTESMFIWYRWDNRRWETLDEMVVNEDKILESSTDDEWMWKAGQVCLKSRQMLLMPFCLYWMRLT